MHNGKKVVLLQCKARCGAAGSLPEETNLEHLKSELIALIVASNLAEDMKRCAKMRAVKLPGKVYVSHHIFSQRHSN
jgi:hypothetical protein